MDNSFLPKEIGFQIEKLVNEQNVFIRQIQTWLLISMQQKNYFLIEIRRLSMMVLLKRNLVNINMYLTLKYFYSYFKLFLEEASKAELYASRMRSKFLGKYGPRAPKKIGKKTALFMQADEFIDLSSDDDSEDDQNPHVSSSSSNEDSEDDQNSHDSSSSSDEDSGDDQNSHDSSLSSDDNSDPQVNI